MIEQWVPALYTVTPTMIERMQVGSVHHAVCRNDNQNDPRGLLIALCGDERGLDSESARHARAIAAQPDLLAACKLALPALQGLCRVAFTGSRIPVEQYPEHAAYLKAYDAIKAAIDKSERGA